MSLSSEQHYQSGMDIEVQKNLGLLVMTLFITAKAYRMLGLLHCRFVPSHNVSVKVNLYIALVHSQLFSYMVNLFIKRHIIGQIGALQYKALMIRPYLQCNY